MKSDTRREFPGRTPSSGPRSLSRGWYADLVSVWSLARSYVIPIAAWDYPRSARRNDELGQRYTLWMEEKFMLLDPVHCSLSQSSDRVLAQLSDELAPQTSPETHAALVEVVTGIHPEVDVAIGELGSVGGRLERELGAMGLAVAAAGTIDSRLGADRSLGRGALSRHRGVAARPLVALIQSLARQKLEGDPSRSCPAPRSSPRTTSWRRATAWTPD